jgi:hypothetical protein
MKILLHPALVDTEIGCMAISLDRLVDTRWKISVTKTRKKCLARPSSLKRIVIGR